MRHFWPAEANCPLFEALRALGAGLARDGKLDAQILARLAKPERYPACRGLAFQVFLRLPVAHGYFDEMLKKNGTFERRFARAFAR